MTRRRAPGHRVTSSALYRALYESIAAHSREGLNVVVDVGHHDAHAVPRGILPDCARRLSGLPVLFVGVRCPLETIMERRRTTGWEIGTPVGAPVRLWQREVHIPGIYDLEVDTTVLGPEACAAVIRRHLDHGPPPSAFRQLAAMTTGSSFLTGSFSSPVRWTPAGASAILADSLSLGSV